MAIQYTDLDGDPSMDIAWNPNGSMCAIEGITSPDGRVLGKMGHTERYSPFVGKNIYGEKYQPLFANGVKYFKQSLCRKRPRRGRFHCSRMQCILN